MTRILNDNLKMNKAKPLNDKELVQTYDELAKERLPYNHMRKHCVENNTDYYYDSNTATWNEYYNPLTSGGSSDDVETKHAYGIQWYNSDSNTVMKRIGNMDLHKSVNLPVQKQLRRCVVKDDGTVNYYLRSDNSLYRSNGSLANLDGTDGQVMVEIPDIWYKCQDIQIEEATNGLGNYILISDVEIKGKNYYKWNSLHLSAFEASLVNNILSSVINTTTSARGGSGIDYLDNTPFSQLGMPKTSLSLTQYRNYAKARGDDWFAYLYQAALELFWLFAIEYCNFNSQDSFTTELTTGTNEVLNKDISLTIGCHKGGLGVGITNISGQAWANYNGYNTLIPCGKTLSLGNNTGVIKYRLPKEFYVINYDNASSSNSIIIQKDSGGIALTDYSAGKYIYDNYKKQLYKCIANATANTELTNTTYFIPAVNDDVTSDKKISSNYYIGEYAVFDNYLYKCIANAPSGTLITNTAYFAYNAPKEMFQVEINSYRGIELPFGHIYKWIDGIKFNIDASTVTNGVSRTYICTDLTKLNDTTNVDGYDYRGNLIRTSGFISKIFAGEQADILPIENNAGSNTYFGDYFYTDIISSFGIRGLLVGGDLSNGSSAGLVCGYSNGAPSYSASKIGSRLCFCKNKIQGGIKVE